MSLDEQSQKRKERLALLKSTKRKREENLSEELAREKEDVESKMKFRNYDPETNAPKLGFIETPIAADQVTVETRAQELAEQTKAEDLANANSSEPLDLFILQTKKPNWDLKRDLNRKLDRLKSKQDAVVARLVRDRINARRVGHGEDETGPSLAMQVERREREMLEATRSEL